MIQVDQLEVIQGDFSLREVSLHIPTGQYGVLMGRTGCGKTTVLEAICGLRKIESGRIVLADRDVTDLKPAARNVGYIPQDGVLFSTMTVRQHLAFAPKVRKLDHHVTGEWIDELADLLDIRHLLNRKPAKLSGGERQRVALGRALSFHPPVLLMDEPLSALDDETRSQMYDVIQRVRRHTGVTALHVTHNVSEAAGLADVLFAFEDGVIQERPLA
ncbi:MAG: ABC transporter ATP-binding protein [Pirellulales bacterium]|nr:ABC transporter ATP-binding protein [Pirellulales bacterium]